jgi:hypothetical protein
MIEGVDNADAIVELTAQAHLRLYPMLGLPESQGAYTDAQAMASYVTAFAYRYGSHGTFWKEHPELPYLPIRSFEIGNEPDMPLNRIADETSLHYTNPGDYALVYATARDALHDADPTAKAVVGGLADFGPVTLTRAESYLAALHPVDAVGYHPYRYSLRAIEAHTRALRRWMDTHGDAGTPIDVNELGASGQYDTSARWGATVAAYTAWALCSPGLRVEDVQPFWWGGVTLPYPDPWLSMVGSQGNPTAFGTAYLAEASTLTSRGCPTTRGAVDRTHRAKALH